MKRSEPGDPAVPGAFLPGAAPAVRARAKDTEGGGAGGGSSEAAPAPNPGSVPTVTPEGRVERKWRSTAYLTIGIPPRAPVG